jgi:hypothetical protein
VGDTNLMNAITLRAHFDGSQIVLDEPFELQPNTELVVTIVPRNQSDEEREEWMNMALSRLAEAYGDDEPDYPLEAIKEFNPDYEGPGYGGR